MNTGSTSLTILRYHGIILREESLLLVSIMKNCWMYNHHIYWLTLITQSQFTTRIDSIVPIEQWALAPRNSQSHVMRVLCHQRYVPATWCLTTYICFMSILKYETFIFSSIFFCLFYSSLLSGSRHYCYSSTIQPEVELWPHRRWQVRLSYKKPIPRL